MKTKIKTKSIIFKLWHDDDGWWVILIEGWSIDGCSGWREDTKKKLMERIRSDAREIPAY